MDRTKVSFKLIADERKQSETCKKRKTNSEVTKTTSEETPNPSVIVRSSQAAVDDSAPHKDQIIHSQPGTTQQIINIGTGTSVRRSSSDAFDDHSLLDERDLSVQIEEIGNLEVERSGGVSHNVLIPDSKEPDWVSWNLGLGTILPGEIDKLKDLSPLQLVQSSFKHLELAKHQIAQLGIQNEDAYFAKSVANTKLDNIAAAHRALMIELDILRADNERLLKLNAEITAEKENILTDNERLLRLNAEITAEKENILKEKDDLGQLNKNLEDALQTQIEKAKKSQFDAGFAFGYKQRNNEMRTYIDQATSPGHNLEL